MSSHSNATEAHGFYYHGVDGGENHAYSGCTLHYSGNTAYSYSTAVATVVPTKGYDRATTADVGSGITIVPFQTISPTTAKHVALLREASPFDIVRVPLMRGARRITPASVRDRLLEWLELTSHGLNTVGNRRQFNDLLEARRTLLERAAGEWAKAMKDKAFAQYESMDVEKIAKEIHARRATEAAKQAKRTRETYRRYLDGKRGKAYLDVVRAVFDDSRDGERRTRMSDGERHLLKKKLGDTGAAFVWLDGDSVRTSRHVAVPLREAKVAMMAWEAGADMRTFKVGAYPVVKYAGSVIQIGCHSIPRANMLALFEAVMGRPFDETRAKSDSAAGCAAGEQVV